VSQVILNNLLMYTEEEAKIVYGVATG